MKKVVFGFLLLAVTAIPSERAHALSFIDPELVSAIIAEHPMFQCVQTGTHIILAEVAIDTWRRTSDIVAVMRETSSAMPEAVDQATRSCAPLFLG